MSQAFRPRLVSLSLKLLLLLRERFDGDLEAAIVYLVLLEQAVRSPTFAALVSGVSGADEHGWAGLHGVNTKSISDSTGIPRETARRKLRELERRHWTLRHQDNLFRVTRVGVLDIQKDWAEMSRILMLAAESAGDASDAGRAD